MRTPGGLLLTDAVEQQRALLGADSTKSRRALTSIRKTTHFSSSTDDEDNDKVNSVFGQKFPTSQYSTAGRVIHVESLNKHLQERDGEDEDFTSAGGQANFDSKIKLAPSPSFFWCNTMRPYCRIFLYFGTLISIILLLYVTLSRDSNSISILSEKSKDDDQPEKEHGKDIYMKQSKSSHRINVEIYMESQCPDTTQFFQEQLVPVYKELKDYINFKIIPFGKAQWSKRENTLEDYSLQCQHGPRECAVNQLMCCGIEKLKNVDKYLPYVICLQGTPPGGREQVKCADAAGLDDKELQECGNGREGRILHQKMGELTKQLSPRMTFIPWIIVDGIREKRAFTELKQVICEKLETKFQMKPKQCNTKSMVDQLPPHFMP